MYQQFTNYLSLGGHSLTSRQVVNNGPNLVNIVKERSLNEVSSRTNIAQDPVGLTQESFALQARPKLRKEIKQTTFRHRKAPLNTSILKTPEGIKTSSR